MKWSVSSFSFFRLLFRAAVCQAFWWGKKQLLEITYPMFPPLAQALSFGSLSHYITIKIIKAGFRIPRLCFTHCMGYSILNVSYQIRSVAHTTTTTTKFTPHPRAVNENTAQIWLTCLPSCLLFSRKYPTDKDSHPEQEKHQEIKHRRIHTGTQRLIQGRHS